MIPSLNVSKTLKHGWNSVDTFHGERTHAISISIALSRTIPDRRSGEMDNPTVCVSSSVHQSCALSVFSW